MWRRTRGTCPHSRVRLFSERANHRHEQVDEEQERNTAYNDSFHSVLLQVFAETDVKAAQDEKHHNHADEDQVTHGISPPIELNSNVRSCCYDDSVDRGVPN